MLERLSPLVSALRNSLLLSSERPEPKVGNEESAPQALRHLFRSNSGLLTEALVVFFLSLAVWVKGMPLVGDFAVDDAYITFSYSKNLASGLGPLYSSGLRVEGYSNFLWMVLTAFGEAVGVGAMAAARAFSHVFFGLTLVATWLLARKFGGRLSAILVVLLLALSSDFHRAIQSGLETVAFSGFIALGLLHYSFESPTRRRLSLLWFSAAALTRIDGFVPFFILVALEGLWWLRNPNTAQLRRLSLWFGIGALPVALYWVWRSSYYGLAFPLPYYAKAASGIEESGVGVEYLWTATRETGTWVLALTAAYGLRGKHHRTMMTLGAFVAIFSGYVAYVGGDWMPMNRMLLPLASPFFVVGAVGLHKAFNQKSLDSAIFARVLGIACTIYVGVHLSQAVVETDAERAKLANAEHLIHHTQGLLAAAPYVRAMLRNPREKLVTDYGGVFAYGSDASVIEMWGLANRDIALKGNHDGIRAMYGKTCVPCYADFQPNYFHATTPLLKQIDSIRSMSQMIGNIFQGPAIDRVLNFRRNYVVGRVVESRTGGVFWFLERKDPGLVLEERRVGDFVVQYPFNRGGPSSHLPRGGVRP